VQRNPYRLPFQMIQKIPNVTIDSTSTHAQCSLGGAGNDRNTGGAEGYAICGG
jgi:hypothetical protein